MRKYRINMIPGKVGAVINASQYDYGYEVQVTLYEGSVPYQIPSGASIRVEGTKSDAKGFSYECRAADGIVYVPIQIQMTAVRGDVPCELVVYKDGMRVGSCNFILAVEESALDGDTDISETDIPAIIAEATEQMEAAASSASQAAASATQAASSAASAETAKTTAMDAAQDAIDAAQELQTAIQFNAALIHDTASGAVASFSDGADYIPMKSVVAEITPTQDLHGQAYPYPPGGGKNLLNPAVFVQREGYNNLSVSSSGNVITITGYDAGGRFACFNVPTIVGQSYTVKLTARNNVTTVSVVESDTQPTAWISGGTAVGVNAAYTYTATKAWAQVWVELSANNATVTNLQFEKGSSATDWSPYSNICPISGRTGMTVTRAGKNLAQINDLNIPTGVNQTPPISDYITLAAGTYTLSWTFTGNVTMTRNQPAFNVENVGHTYSGINCTTSGRYSWTFTLTAETTLRLEWWYHTVSAACSVTDFMLEFGDTAHEYAPYVAPTTYPITWQTEAGTIYGGNLDVVSGVLTVDRAIVDLGNMSWGWSSNGYFFSSTIQSLIEPPKTASEKTTAICSMYKAETTNDIRDNTVDSAFGVVQVNSGVNTGRVWIRDTSKGTDTAAFKTAVTGQTLVYPLATPQTYQLTPTEVKTLLGGNNIYTDAGSVSVEYVADTKMYIDKKIAELQALVLEN